MNKTNKYASPDVFTFIDLEMNQPSGKIIEIGICIGNVKTGKTLLKSSLYVNPHEKLSDFIMKLTGITQEQVDDGLSLLEAYTIAATWHTEYQAFVNPITWGCGDMDLLKSQVYTPRNRLLGYLGLIRLPKHAFGRRYVDVKTLYVFSRLTQGKQLSGGLAKAMTRFGLSFKGRKHCGADDAENTFILFKHLLDRCAGSFQERSG